MNNLRLTLVLGFIGLFTNQLNSQTYGYDWIKQSSGSLIDNITCSETDVNGNLYYAGNFQGTIDLNPDAGTQSVTSAAGLDNFIIKLNASGDFIWGKVLAGTGNSRLNDITISSAGNVYVVGSFDGQLDLDPGSGTSINTHGGSGLYSTFIAQLDANGLFSWGNKLAAGPNTTDFVDAYTIDCDASSNIYIGGTFSGESDFDFGSGVQTIQALNSGTKAFFVKYTSTGTYVNKKAYGSSANSNLKAQISNLKVDITSSTVAVLGYVSNQVSGTSTHKGAKDVFVEKLDLNLTPIWNKQFGGALDDEGSAIDILTSGDVIIGGTFQSVADFDPSNTTNFNLTTTTGTDVFVCKLNTTGAFVWAKQIGDITVSDNCKALKVVADSVFISGSFQGTCDFDPNTISNVTRTSLGQYDAYLLKLDPTGNFVRVYTYGSTTVTSDEELRDFEIEIDGAYLLGNFSGIVDFDHTPTVRNTTSNGNSLDGFVLHLTTCIAPQAPTNIIGELFPCSGTSYTYTADPVSGATSYNWTLANGWTGTSTTNTISVLTNTSNGEISVSAENVCGVSDVITGYININNIPTAPTAIQGSGVVCSTTSQTYSVAAVANATFYTWTFPNDWTNTATTNSVTAIAGASWGNISVVAGNSCGISSPTTFSVIAHETPVVVTNDVSVCLGNSATLNATSTAGFLDWYALTTGNVVVGSGASFITPPVNANVTYYVQANNNGCTTTPARIPVNVTVNPNPSTTITQASLTLSAGQNGATYQWLDCNNANTAISGETSQSFTAIVNGSYAVEVNLNGCVDTSNCVSINGIGIKEVSTLEGVTIYPNPTSGKFSIKLADSKMKVFVEIVNVVGEIIYSTNVIDADNLSLDLNLQDGVYFVKVVESHFQKASVFKLIKQ